MSQRKRRKDKIKADFTHWESPNPATNNMTHRIHCIKSLRTLTCMLGKLRVTREFTQQWNPSQAKPGMIIITHGLSLNDALAVTHRILETMDPAINFAIMSKQFP